MQTITLKSQDKDSSGRKKKKQLLYSICTDNMSQQNEDPRCQVSIKELNLLQKYLFQMDPVEDWLAL